MDALTISNLEEAQRLKEKPEETPEKDRDKMNRMACGIIRYYLIQDIKYNVMNKTSARKIWEILKSKYLTKRIEYRLHLKRRIYRFQSKKRISIGRLINDYIKLLADLSNVDMVIEEEDNALIMLSSLPDEDYETFVLSIINGK